MAVLPATFLLQIVLHEIYADKMPASYLSPFFIWISQVSELSPV